MRLLILTQELNRDGDVLGFFHSWVFEFAKNCEKVTVICLKKGRVELPDNVKVLSLGKEEGASRLKYIFRFYKYIWQERGEYDKVFVHMNQIYVILGGLFWKIWGKRVGLWYTHKQVSFSLRMAEKLVDVIFTASKESFRLESEKLNVMGHGIDTDVYRALEDREENDVFRILTVGRISPIKDVKTLVRAMIKLKGRNIKLEIVGGAGTAEQEKYFEEVKELVSEGGIEDKIKFIGSVPNEEVLKYYQNADLVVNMAPTGGLDKVILEAMACEVPVIVCNKTMEKDLSKFGDMLIFEHGDYKELAGRIERVMDMGIDERRKMGEGLRRIVVEKHNLGSLINRILKF